MQTGHKKQTTFREYFNDNEQIIENLKLFESKELKMAPIDLRQLVQKVYLLLLVPKELVPIAYKLGRCARIVGIEKMINALRER